MSTPDEFKPTPENVTRLPDLPATDGELLEASGDVYPVRLKVAAYLPAGPHPTSVDVEIGDPDVVVTEQFIAGIVAALGRLCQPPTAGEPAVTVTGPGVVARFPSPVQGGQS